LRGGDPFGKIDRTVVRPHSSRRRTMFYDDEARRFNFLSGLLLGAVLGTGLGLIAAPQGRRKMSRKTRQYGAALKHAVEKAGKGGKPTAGASRLPSIETLRSAARRMSR
jgi:gas vesicle protein